MVCVCEGMNRDRVGVGVGGAQYVVFLHFFELITQDGGDVFWGGLWDVYVDQEGAGRGRVIGVYAC